VIDGEKLQELGELLFLEAPDIVFVIDIPS
jgi:hypothetical protein